MTSRLSSTSEILGLAPIALVIAIWQALVSSGLAPAVLLPPPGIVFGRLLQQLVTWTFQQEIVATLFRLFAGFAIAVLFGVAVGIAAAANPAINAIVKPIVRVLAPLPKVALYPALLLLLGLMLSRETFLDLAFDLGVLFRFSLLFLARNKNEERNHDWEYEKLFHGDG